MSGPLTTRRTFIQVLGAAGAAALVAPRSARAADSRIDILLDEPIGPIAPELYGHFAEHLGGVVYDGIWVGDGSPVPNDGGIRRSLVERLKQIKAPVIRWPGGCFADSYDWRDGIGPRASRATRTNFWVNTKVPASPSQYDPNSFGTVEFARFCKLAGAQPYLAANIRSLPAKDLYQWIEFCNSPAGTTTLAGVRAAEGSPDPLNVVYWGVGNEPWGCGGDFSPEDYAVELKRYTAWVPSYDLQLRYIAAGANSGDVEWTRRFFDKLTAGNPGMAGRLWGFSFHHYAWNVSSGKTTDWNEGKGPAVGFTLEQHYELLRDADKMDGFITAHWQTMGQFDRARKVKLVVDEWGAWHKPGSESDPSHTLGQVSTLRDALLAGLTLDTFQRHADKVGMANIAQLVNCLQSLFVAHESKFIVTPNYHVFQMYMDHMGAESVRTEFMAPRVSYQRNGQPATFWGLAGSASRRDKTVTLTVVNPSAADARETTVSVRGAKIASAAITTLTAGALDAHNSFDAPDAVPTPKESPVTPGAAGDLIVTLPKASVSKIRVTLV
jgi:alpha-N-arabinofuranosidase